MALNWKDYIEERTDVPSCDGFGGRATTCSMPRKLRSQRSDADLLSEAEAQGRGVNPGTDKRTRHLAGHKNGA